MSGIGEGATRQWCPVWLRYVVSSFLLQRGARGLMMLYPLLFDDRVVPSPTSWKRKVNPCHTHTIQSHYAMASFDSHSTSACMSNPYAFHFCERSQLVFILSRLRSNSVSIIYWHCILIFRIITRGQILYLVIGSSFSGP
jgi:hypothetical protein